MSRCKRKAPREKGLSTISRGSLHPVKLNLLFIIGEKSARMEDYRYPSTQEKGSQHNKKPLSIVGFQTLRGWGRATLDPALALWQSTPFLCQLVPGRPKSVVLPSLAVSQIICLIFWEAVTPCIWQTSLNCFHNSLSIPRRMIVSVGKGTLSLWCWGIWMNTL